MQIVIKYEVNRIKNGWAAKATEMGLTAHGHSPQVAKLNLERGVRLFFAPFERSGDLVKEVEQMGLQLRAAGELGLTITLDRCLPAVAKAEGRE